MSVGSRCTSRKEEPVSTPLQHPPLLGDHHHTLLINHFTGDVSHALLGSRGTRGLLGIAAMATVLVSMASAAHADTRLSSDQDALDLSAEGASAADCTTDGAKVSLTVAYGQGVNAD